MAAQPEFRLEPFAYARRGRWSAGSASPSPSRSRSSAAATARSRRRGRSSRPRTTTTRRVRGDGRGLPGGSATAIDAGQPDHGPRRLRRRRRRRRRRSWSARCGELGADCDWLIPDRLARRLRAHARRASSGWPSAARAASSRSTAGSHVGRGGRSAAELGIAVVVTDHHEPGAELPDCPIVHPRRRRLSVRRALRRRRRLQARGALRGGEARARRPRPRRARDRRRHGPAASARTARSCGAGSRVARRAPRPGMRALMAVSQVRPSAWTRVDFGFRLGPRINAAGRLYRADAGVELLLTDDEDRADGDRGRARPRQPRAPRGRARGGRPRPRGPAASSRPSSPMPRRWFWRARAGIRASSASSPRGSSSATASRSCSSGSTSRGAAAARRAASPASTCSAGLDACAEHLDPLRRPSRRRRARDRGATRLRPSARRSPRTCAAAAGEARAAAGDDRRGRRRREPRPRRRRAARAARRRSAAATPGCACSSPARGVGRSAADGRGRAPRPLQPRERLAPRRRRRLRRQRQARCAAARRPSRRTSRSRWS